MTNEEAIYILLRSNEYHHAKGDLPHSAASIEAFNKAIDALKAERPKGEWIRTGSLGNGNAHYECSNCHYGDEHAESQEVPYCWHCGAKMKKGGEEE